MSQDLEHSAQVINAAQEDDRGGLLDDMGTPMDDDSIACSSQQTIPSTEAPNSPAADPASSFKTELNEDAGSVIPSSLTPPPSSQVPLVPGAGVVNPLGFAASHRTGIFSPPATGFHGIARDAALAPDFAPPTTTQIETAAAEELRTMLQACVTEHARLKMEAAHHKLQYSLLQMQADEDAQRAAVEHEMTRKEVEALRIAEQTRQARRDLVITNEASQARYYQLQADHQRVLVENEDLARKYKAARKVIQQKEDEIAGLVDERDTLLNRIRENREHFHLLCSPGGMFHSALTSKPAAATPVQHRATPRQTPRTQREARPDRDHSKENFAVLLQALSQDNNSAPSTPLPGHRPIARVQAKHTRNVQSMSSLPTTPVARSRLDAGGLLPSADLVPQTEPPYRAARFVPETPTSKNRAHKSRESTVSADDNEELARQALAASFASLGSQSRSQRQPSGHEEEVFESQASQAASEMLRRDPRESFEVASSVHSRDGTPAPAEKSAKLQAKLFGGLNKSGVASSEKRKFSGHGETRDDVSVRDPQTSPTKKLRMAGGLRDPGRVGLGIRYGQEA